MISSKSGCLLAKWLYSCKEVVFGQNGCIRAELVVFGQSGCIRTKVVALVQSGSIRERLVVLLQSCCDQAKWL